MKTKARSALGSPQTTADIFNSLAGEWRIVRSITPGGYLEGTATFVVSDAATLFYHEEGVLTLPDNSQIAGFQDYLYRLDGDDIAVYFQSEPSRLFQRIRPEVDACSSLVAEAYHRCIDDDYHSTYTFQDPAQFVVRHSVRGPRKNYVMTTTYSKT